ncbi:hypothetical protein AGMMS49992_15700 [Clostridia bacterium]|nr:hypothetical protein AGMMS49992_15700 [Clostridia bacterium]
MLDFSAIRTQSAFGRINLVTLDTLARVETRAVDDWDAPDFQTLCERVVKARRNDRPVIMSIGAHVVKCGLSRYLIALLREGIVTHLAGNGASSIHDFELAYLGGTSEHVPTAIEDGTFGMWEETGAWMNEAIRLGAASGKGYGRALAEYIDEHPAQFPYKDECVLYQAWRMGIPATYSIALGTDIIHQHPSADFAAIGFASGQDFKVLCESVAELEGGVFLNFGSAVIGPEVFLKALSIARNLGHPTTDITTANFDLVDLGDYKKPIGYDDPQYYYRPRKNIVNRPVSRGGMGWHFVGDHAATIPALYRRVNALMGLLC